MKEALYFLAGLAILLMNKIRYAIKGYQTPRPFDLSNIAKAIEYDYSVVSGWKRQLMEYTGLDNPFYGASVLELGPGDNLGTGAILLDNGAKRYTAFDRNDLLSSAPTQLYDQLGKKLKDERSRQSIKKYLNNQDGDLEFFYDTNFKLLSLPRHDFNLVVSQAAFEHFENPQRVISELARVCLPGAVLCAEIDLATHSRWIRDVDPNNIYRFPTWLYSILKYSGIPNRVRPNEYKEWLAANGWKNIRIIPLVYINKKTHGHTLRGLRKDFNDEFSDTSSFVLLATFSGGKKQSE